jgi:hypothetical protein
MRTAAPSAAAAIVGLLFRSSPTAVIRRVASVVVYAVDRMTRRWASSHVGQEIFKALPSLADSNASASVIGIGWIGWSAASGFHFHPSAVFAGALSSGVAMRGVSLNEQFSGKTSATRIQNAFERGGRYVCDRTAFAPAAPHHRRMTRAVKLSRCVTDNRPASDLCPDKGSLREHRMAADVRRVLSGLIATPRSSFLVDVSYSAASTLAVHKVHCNTETAPKLWRSGSARAEAYAP